ncbi:MAG: glutamine amidotransferase [Candidatus Loosdrechtia sp.]|uniref:glutamine amidotransferase n=1 Tax=Candidatus Loosdrechtia sp. TaxID=3101272 RepID=UPI003A5D24E6|nr:MAG: glutamine amidotransferase [Candidatus Jettenia sp. AMX2]
MENFIKWNVSFTGIENTGLRVIVILAAIAACYFSWYGIKAVHPVRKRWLLLALRFTAILLMSILLLQPQIEQKEVVRLRNKVACLLDNSKSMTLKGGDTGIARYRLVNDFFKDNASFINQLHKNFDVDYLTFSDILKEISYHDVERGFVFDGENTDFAQMLKLLKKRYDGKSVMGYLIFSDGADTVELPSNVNKPDIISKLTKDLSAPFFTFSPSDTLKVKDIAISNISYDSFTFVRSPWKAEVTVKVFGYKDLKLPVTLKQGKDIISSRVLDISEGELHIDLSFTPYTTGTFLYTISIPVQPGESITENNQVSFLVKVVRDKIRVMHVCGRPSWDERFLRRVLKSDPNIDLISFFILRTPTDTSEARNEELSLIPFPVDELFTQALNSFDLIIFQNFDYRPYDTSFFRFSHYLQNLRRFVTEQGGGFVMVGGDISFSQGGYDGTAIEDILPLDLNAEKDTIDTSRLKAVLTADGLKHPVTALDENAERNSNIWKDLPELDGCNITTRMKANAVLLAVFPTQGNPPLISVQDTGSGRCMAVTTDSLWRWGFLPVGKGGSNRHYIKFWQNAIKWLIKDPTLNPVRATVNKETFLPNEEIQGKIEVLGRNYQPLEGVQLDIEVTNEFSGKSIFVGNEITGSDGQFRFTLKHGLEGYFIVKAVARKENEEIGQDYTVFNIAVKNKEFNDPSIRSDILAKMAEVSGGKYFHLPTKNAGEKISIENPSVTKLVGKRQISLWDNWYAFTVILTIVSFEWWIRKRSGLS